MTTVIQEPGIVLNSYDQLQRKTKNGIVYLDKWQSRPLSGVWKSHYSSSSRPHPTSLWNNQTPRPLIETIWADAGSGHTVRNYWKDENGVPAHYILEWWFYPAWGVLEFDHSVTEPDWITPLRLQIKEEKVSIGQDLAEYRQTVDLYSQTAKSIAYAWKHYKRAKRLRFRKGRPGPTICDVAAARIVYAFGISPLIGTLYDSYQALDKRLTRPILKKYVQSAREERTDSQESTEFVGKCFIRKSSHAKVYVSYDPETLSSFSLGNPVEIAWELVPFSFLFDYMIPFGDYLKSLDALKGVKEIHGHVTQKTRIVEKVWKNASTCALALQGYPIGNHSPSVLYRKQYERDVLSSIPLPPVPRWKPSASYRKLANAVSLLVLQRKDELETCDRFRR